LRRGREAPQILTIFRGIPISSARSNHADPVSLCLLQPLMGIARRKAGNVVRCPTCAGQVMCATPGAEVSNQGSGPQPAAGGLFEQSDIERDLLNATASRIGGRRGNGRRPGQSRDDAIDVEAVSMPLMMGTAAQESGLHLSHGGGGDAGLLMVVLLGAAFFRGIGGGPLGAGLKG